MKTKIALLIALLALPPAVWGNALAGAPHVEPACRTEEKCPAADSSLFTPRYSLPQDVVVTAAAHHQLRQSSPSPVYAIRARELRAIGATSLDDALQRLMPQFSTAPTSMGSFLRMNGLGNKHILILLDGQRLIGDMSGNIDLSRINLSRIKRIEVLPGAASALYGSDAIAGVINIITTADPHRDGLPRLRLRPSAPADDADPLRFNASAATRLSGKGQQQECLLLTLAWKGLTSETSLQHSQARSFRNNTYEYVSGQEGETRQSLAPLSIGYKADALTERLSLKLSSRLRLHAQADLSQKETDRPNTQDSITGGYDYELKSKGLRLSAGAVYKPAKKTSILLDLTSDNYEYGHHYDTQTQDHPIGDYVLAKRQRMLSACLKAICQPFKGATTVAGLRMERNHLRSTSGDVDTHQTSAAACLSHEQTLAPTLSMACGIQLSCTKPENVGATQVSARTAWGLTPQLSLLYSKGPLALRLGYSQGYRSPGLDELYYHYYTYSRSRTTITIGNENLKPEQSHYLSLNAEWTSPLLSLSLTAYLNLISNMINKEAVTVDDAQRERLKQLFTEMSDDAAQSLTKYSHYVNSDKGRVEGLSANIILRPCPKLSLNLNYALTNARYKEPQEGWANLERSIRHTLVLSANYSLSCRRYNLSINLNARLQSKTFYTAYDNAPGFQIFNLMTRHQFKLKRGPSLEASIGIDNILNQRDTRIDSDMTRYANFSPGRMIVAGLRVEL